MAESPGPSRTDQSPQRDDLPAGSPAHPWDRFVTGQENELAFAGAQALARGQREGISPLVIHGPSSVGKSRLLSGLVVEWLRRQPGATVAHVPAIEFAESCLEAARQPERSGWIELHDRFRSVDLLALDDLEGLERNPIAQDELVHVLDALESLGSSVAVTSRQPLGQWERGHWTVRLLSRLTAGLSVRIDPPALSSRRRYLLEETRARGLSLAAEAVESLASSADGYRTLDGWMSRLALQSTLQFGRPHAGQQPGTARARPLDLTTVLELLADETEMASAPPTMEAIVKGVANRFGVRPTALRGPSRQATVAQARHLAMYLARLHTGSSFAVIGAYFGGRDPATVRHACKATAARIADDPSLAAAVASLPLKTQR